MAAAAAAVARAGAAQAPAWLRKHGPGRVASEMRSLQKSVASGVLPGVRKVRGGPPAGCIACRRRPNAKGARMGTPPPDTFSIAAAAMALIGGAPE